MNRLINFVMFLSIFFTSVLCFADLKPWQVNAEKSELTFTATQNNAPVTCSFKKFQTDITFDPENLSASKIKVVIDMGSVHSEYEDLITTLISPDWFDVDQFPQATFQSETISKKASQQFTAVGKLTIRDKTQPATLEFTLEKFTPTEAHAKGQIDLLRLDYGIGQGEWASTDDVNNEVTVNFVIHANKL